MTRDAVALSILVQVSNCFARGIVILLRSQSGNYKLNQTWLRQVGFGQSESLSPTIVAVAMLTRSLQLWWDKSRFDSSPPWAQSQGLDGLPLFSYSRLSSLQGVSCSYSSRIVQHDKEVGSRIYCTKHRFERHRLLNSDAWVRHHGKGETSLVAGIDTTRKFNS